MPSAEPDSRPLLAVLDPAPVLAEVDRTRPTYGNWWMHEMPEPGDPRCDLPPPDRCLRDWWYAEREGVSRCHRPPDHPGVHMGVMVTRASTTGEVGTPAADGFSLYQWPRSEADAPAGDP